MNKMIIKMSIINNNFNFNNNNKINTNNVSMVVFKILNKQLLLN